MKEALTPLDQLKSVLCDPEGKCCIAGSAEDRAVVDRALHALAQPPLPAQEPDELTIAYMSGLYDGKKKRPWAGLTDEERSQLVTLHHGWNEYGQAIEAALRSKNT
jgi:hypothetical protein